RPKHWRTHLPFGIEDPCLSAVLSDGGIDRLHRAQAHGWRGHGRAIFRIETLVVSHAIFCGGRRAKMLHWRPLKDEGRDKTMASLNQQTREKLTTVSVATLTTCLFKRGLRNQFIQDVHPVNPGAGKMVGEAYTLRTIPAREDLNPITVFQNLSHPQRKAIEECPPGAVLVLAIRTDPR